MSNSHPIEFPQYRKIINGKSFYKINDSKLFEEIQLIGNLKRHYIIEAKQYPEMLRIQDMLNLEPPFLNMNESEWIELSSFLK